MSPKEKVYPIMKSASELYERMSKARVLLAPALIRSKNLHEWDETSNPFGTLACDCSGCYVRKLIEEALDALEV